MSLVLLCLFILSGSTGIIVQCNNIPIIPALKFDLKFDTVNDRLGALDESETFSTVPQEEFQLPGENETTITISLVGDCTLGTDESFSYINSFPYRFKKENEDYGYFFRGVKEVFENDDLTLVNLETTFTKAHKKANKKFCFKGDLSYVNILKEGSVEAVNIANNHIYDYLEQGFNDTLSTLEAAGILYSGEGYIAYFSIKGFIVASLGFRGWSISIKDQVGQEIKKACEKADIVIVSFHWGQERSNYPNAVQRELGRYAIDQGADLVAGHHPHVIQGIEKYKGRYIVYSLANFCFGGNRNPSDKDTFIFQNCFTFNGDELKNVKGMIIPCQVSSLKEVNDYQPTILEGKEKERVLNRILKYSRELEYGITEENIDKFSSVNLPPCFFKKRQIYGKI